MCPEIFTSKPEYSLHTQNHAENGPATLVCKICNWPFDDSLALEQHRINSGHGSPRYSCGDCGVKFLTSRGREDHMRHPGCSKEYAGASASQPSLPPLPAHHPLPTKPPNTEVRCDRCAKIFRTSKEYQHHRSYKANTACADHKHKTPPKNRVGYVDPDKPKDVLNKVLGYEDSSEEEGAASDSDSPTNMSDKEAWCSRCKTQFTSRAQFNAHVLRCSAKYGSNDVAPVVRVPAVSVASRVSESIQPSLSTVARRPPPAPQHHRQVPVMPQAAAAPALAQPSTSPATDTFVCNVCQKVCRSEPGLKVHKQDVHGIGGRPVDFDGRDAWMLNQRAREQRKQDIILQPPLSGPSRGRGQGPPNHGGRGAPPPAQLPVRPAARPPQLPAHTFRTHPTESPSVPAYGMPLPGPARHAPGPVPTSLNIGGPYEIEQAKYIQGKILRLLIQSDIFIHHDGKITVCGIDWTRIGVQKQVELAGMFDSMCHLPKALQGEYLPHPKAFSAESHVQYPAFEFMPSPPHDRSKPGLSVVVIACSKVVLPNGRQEVVKVAAIDLITCRILMNHLVCTDPKADVANWRSNETGLFSWIDMEQARKLGYKVFKGWYGARAALSKLIDKETIIVGHNLRSDLDCLRMEHGRAVDIIKVAEKAAKGPLSKVQLALDSLCRDYPAVHLKTDPEYGRDVLMNAFAIREIGLWVIKNREKFEKGIREKSRVYEMVMPRTAAADRDDALMR
ncbi:hypothetical protein CC86DRAFT_368065 [Ophiobolus disseminans]|uniref:C2H2-type domain-containing protein n=1 Tax=Ophiobolus disseminans TaxID=1469910 RepID=A0A6A7ABJ1_9PLEO|nr:hypothetical protein CC86DRAFT_368065 [Ophiobolus disseminans]